MVSPLTYRVRAALIGLAFLLTLRAGCGAALAGGSWQKLETARVVVHYTRSEDLARLDDNIDYAPGQWSLGSLFGAGSSGQGANGLARKLDALFERVQEILDMRGGAKKVNIELYGDTEALGRAYRDIAGSECRIRAWYIFERNTIFINAADVSEGMLAHELAHSIIDHYFSVRPPKATAEILARYVDEHLND